MFEAIGVLFFISGNVHMYGFAVTESREHCIDMVTKAANRPIASEIIRTKTVACRWISKHNRITPLHPIVNVIDESAFIFSADAPIVRKALPPPTPQMKG